MDNLLSLLILDMADLSQALTDDELGWLQILKGRRDDAEDRVQQAQQQLRVAREQLTQASGALHMEVERLLTQVRDLPSEASVSLETGEITLPDGYEQKGDA